MRLSRFAALIFAVFLCSTIPLTKSQTPPRDSTMSVSKPESDNSVQAELRSFELSEGYDINLFADESDGVANPICLSWDSAGRLWVLCTWAYPQSRPLDSPNDQLLIIEDTNGDGRADKTTVFADDLNMPTGFALGHGGVYIGEGTDLLHLEDSDGDGRADKRRVLLTGFGTGDTHQNINSFTWSPGGELFFSQGLHTFSRVETPWGIRRLDEYGSWRLRPLRLQLDGFYKTSSGANPWGIVFGNWGEPFVKSNGPGISELLPHMVSLQNPPKAARVTETEIGKTLIKSMILEIAESPHLPDDLQSDLLIAGYFARDVNRFQWETDGSGHRLESQPNLIKSSYNAFRPVDIRIGPDGAIYIADWFNPIIGHYQASLRHPDRDKSHGRIWRVTAKGRPLANSPDISKMNAAELCEQLESDWRYLRYQAKRRLADMPRDEAIPAIEHWLADLDQQDPKREHHLYEAIGVFESHEIVNLPLLRQLLSAKEPRARAYATRVLGRWHEHIASPLELLETLVADESPRVRLEAIVACSEIDQPESMVVAAKALNLPMDRFASYALTQTAYALAPQWLPALEKGNLPFEKPEHLVFALKETADKSTVVTVRKLLDAGNLARQDVESLMALLVEIGNAQDLRWVLDHASMAPHTLSALVDAFQIHGVKPAGDLVSPLTQMLASHNPLLQTQSIRLAGHWKIDPLADSIYQMFTDEEAPIALRSAAIESLGQLHGRQILATAIEAVRSPAPGLRQAALRTVCAIDLSRAAQTANDLLRRADHSWNASEIIAPFLGYQQGLSSLASSLGETPIPPELATRIQSVMAASGRYDPSLSAVLASASTIHSIDIPDYSESFVNTLSAEVKRAGNAANGARVYASTTLNCIACHKIENEGGTLGPDLSAVGSGLPTELLIEAVLWPKRQVKEGFLATTISTNEGEMISGYLHTEDRNRIVIRDSVTGTLRALSPKQVKTREEAGTLMPPGLTAGLSRSELRDLIRYLAELKGSGASSLN